MLKETQLRAVFVKGRQFQMVSSDATGDGESPSEGNKGEEDNAMVIAEQEETVNN